MAVANPKNVDWFERNANERLLRESFRSRQDCSQCNDVPETDFPVQRVTCTSQFSSAAT
jgi:hypothetical protein